MKLTGDEELIRTLLKMSADVSGPIVREAVIAGAEPIRERAAENVTRGPGAPDLADHIVISPTRRSHPDDAIAVAVGPSREERGDGRRFDVQGIFLEFGTVKTRQQAFLRPALDAEGEAVGEDIVRRVLRKLEELA